MLLKELKNLDSNIEIIYEMEDNVVMYVENLTESKVRVGLGFGNTKGGLVSKTLQGITGFAKSHPWITSAAMVYGLNALKKYKKNKKKTVTFYTQDQQERTMYKDIVKTLMSSGKYRKEKDTYIDGGYLWVLKRID